MPLPPGVTLAPSTGVLSGTPTTDGTFPATFTVTDSLGASVSAPLVFTIAPASTTTGIPGTSSVDSLIIADQIELLGGSVPSVNPACEGAVFLLQPGYDLGAPQPTTDIVGSLILDGERPFGYRASDRQITLPIMIDCRFAQDGQGGFAALTGAYEVLMQAIDEQEWTLTWTRANGLPLVFDCFRAQPTVVQWGGADQNNISAVGAVSLTFTALPYGRSDTPTEILVASPLPGHALPAQPVVLDDFHIISGAPNFLTGPSANFEGGLGTWRAGANDTVALSTAQANSGVSSLALTSTASGNMNAVMCTAASILANGMPVIPGSTVTASGWFRGAASGRSVNVGVDFYDNTGTFISTLRGPNAADTTTGFTEATALVTVPAGAAVCRLNPQVLATGAGAEVHYFDDAFMAVTQWQPSNRCVVGPQSANWDPSNPPINSASGAGSQPGAFYAATIQAGADLTGLPSLSVWAGFGSDYWETWHKGPATFAFTLTDVNGTTIGFSRTMTVRASDDSNAPKWQRVTAAIPQGQPGFDYTQPAAYTINVTNRGYHTLRFTQLYLDALTANPQSVQNFPTTRGAMYSLLGVQGTARTTCSAEFQLPPGIIGSPVTVTLPGPTGTPQTWICPPGVTSVAVGCWGASAGAYVGGSGGGGYSANASVAVTPQQQYTYVIGAGTQATRFGQAAPAAVPTYFAGDAATVTAQPGAPGTHTTGGAGGTGTTHNGGAGSTGTAGGNSGAGGGSAGATGAGGAASGTTPGTAGTGGGAAGGAGTSSDRDGFPGHYPGGGAGGVSDTGDNIPGAGADGQIVLTYTPAVSQFSTLIVHRPGPAAPPDLSPLVSFGATDVPNGAIEYPVQSLTDGVLATFGGTYSVVAVGGTWNAPGLPRTVTLTVKQYEYQGGPSYTTSVTRTFTPNTDTFIPGGATLAQVPIVTLGEITLPLQEMAPDNVSGLFTITITDTNTNDLWLDCCFLDSTGQTVMVGIPQAGAYAAMYIDEPETSQAIGRVMGSDFGRAQAVSVMQNALVSGGPLFLTPGDNLLLVYAAEGAPALSVNYFSKYFLGRTS